ncbi:MAG: LLM class flavin-dependent oxidoreductase [Ardenticatenaceae bacterium]|nr:LLM class flavin-dependent oxidoreductase [Ardenticatenaceae bacterium]HBY94322.1 hypothetical protein [Chloroflexota bacterium]
MRPRFGINLNNRFPLLAPGYTLNDLLHLSGVVESTGFDSVWVGDSLFSKPRYEPLLLLAAISQRTERLLLGTACLVTATRNPLYLALQWATLHRMAGGRTILGACMGNPEEGVRREYAALGLDFERRGALFEEGLAVLRSLWSEGCVTARGQFFNYSDISFFTGVEVDTLVPLQPRPPIWVVSNPRLLPRAKETTSIDTVVGRAARRIARYGDGWLTCCRAGHPEEFQEQRAQIRAAAEEIGRAFGEYTLAYQVTLNISADRMAAQRGVSAYLNQYYHTSTARDVDPAEWGPVGNPDDAIRWFKTFADAGVNHFICRFASLDQFGQVERFAKEVLPAFP